MACATLKRSLEWDPLPGIGSPRSAKRRRYVPFSAPTTPSRQNQSHPEFLEAAPKLTTDLIANSVCNEVKRLQRRKQLPHFSMTSPPGSPTSSGEATTSVHDSSQNNVAPLFTFKQVNLICERLLREREDELRQNYDRVLNEKLAEQYDAFVRFTQDQIQRRFAGQGAPSYCS